MHTTGLRLLKSRIAEYCATRSIRAWRETYSPMLSPRAEELHLRGAEGHEGGQDMYIYTHHTPTCITYIHTHIFTSLCQKKLSFVKLSWCWNFFFFSPHWSFTTCNSVLVWLWVKREALNAVIIFAQRPKLRIWSCLIDTQRSHLYYNVFLQRWLCKIWSIFIAYLWFVWSVSWLTESSVKLMWLRADQKYCGQKLCSQEQATGAC